MSDAAVTLSVRRSSQFAGVRDVAPGRSAHGIGGKRYHGERNATQRRELDLVGRAIPVDQNDGTDVSLPQSLLGQVRGEDDRVQFFEHASDLEQNAEPREPCWRSIPLGPYKL
jgi:hypothetical protein